MPCIFSSIQRTCIKPNQTKHWAETQLSLTSMVFFCFFFFKRQVVFLASTQTNNAMTAQPYISISNSRMPSNVLVRCDTYLHLDYMCARSRSISYRRLEPHITKKKNHRWLSYKENCAGFNRDTFNFIANACDIIVHINFMISEHNDFAKCVFGCDDSQMDIASSNGVDGKFIQNANSV